MELCIYCQARPGLTRDHVPPKGLFGEPRPSNLVTVPACADCNRSFQNDDEYFLAIATEWSAAETADGAAVSAKQVRAIRRPEARKRWKPFLESLVPAEIRSNAGLIIANSLAARLDTRRLVNTVNRIVRGMYYHVFGTILPPTAHVGSMPLGQYNKRHKERPGATDFVQLVPYLPGGMIGNNTFAFRHFVIDEQSHRSFWYLTFYEQFAFVAATDNERAIRKDVRQ